MSDKILKREEIEEKYKWDLSELCTSFEDLDNKIGKFLSYIPKLEEYKGKLSNKAKLLELLKLNSETLELANKIAVYAMQRKDENAKDSTAVSYNDKCGMAFVKYSMATAYIEPELASLSEEYIKECVNCEEFKNFDIQLLDVLRTKSHTLSEKEENILAAAGDVLGSAHDIFNMLDNADLKFGQIKDENDNEIELSHSRYGLLLASKNREVRKNVYEQYYKEYKDHINTIAATYISNVKKDVFLSRVRGFETFLDYSTFYENADKRAYLNLLKNINKPLPAVHRYINLRKNFMNYEDIHFYDLYVSLIENDSLKVSFEEAFDIVKKALAPLGNEYINQLQIAKDERWIDVFNNEGKRSGAYSVAAFGAHPFVLLNYEKTVHDVFTIAHELGHAMHSFYSNNNQPFEKADYTIFVAEVASTVNEVLLIRYLIDHTDDVEMKKFCLNYFLDMFRTTLFRQTMFAEFEYIAHSYIEKDEALTYEILSNEYEKLNRKYYGDEIVHDDCIKYEWARIPHFYRAYYVYKYATGITSAVSIAYNILEKGESALNNYMTFLKSGCTKPPVELLKIAGVDLTTDEPFINANNVFEKTLKELEELIK